MREVITIPTYLLNDDDLTRLVRTAREVNEELGPDNVTSDFMHHALRILRAREEDEVGPIEVPVQN